VIEVLNWIFDSWTHYLGILLLFAVVGNVSISVYDKRKEE